MRAIHLVRHAKPLFDASLHVRGGDLAPLIGAYDQAALESIPPPMAIGDVGVLFASDLRRSTESAAAFFPRLTYRSLSVFREAETPQRLPRFLALRFSTATILARGAWLCGYSPGIESFAEARVRAKEASTILVAKSQAPGDVVLVGHGFFNRMIGNALKGLGWKLCASTGDSFGGIRTYTAC